MWTIFVFPITYSTCRYLSQERVGGDSKILMIIYYDQHGEVSAVGAEALREGLQKTAEDQDWMKAEWFLHSPPLSQPNIIQIS